MPSIRRLGFKWEQQARLTGDHPAHLQVSVTNHIRQRRRPSTDGPTPGDGSNAVRIAQLRSAAFRLESGETDLKQRLLLDNNHGTTTIEYFYRDTIARLGIDTQESSRMTENQNSLLELLTNRRLAISGVSLDEEMANMVQFQLAYQASARFLVTLNEIYDTLINRTVR